MIPATLDFSHYKGDTFSEVPFEILIDAVSLDLTDALIKMQLRRNYEKDVALEFSTINNKIEIVDASLGTFKIVEQIINIEAFEYIYDLQITLANNEVETYVKGKFNIVNDVTR
jgi:hypothetical protein